MRPLQRKKIPQKRITLYIGVIYLGGIQSKFHAILVLGGRQLIRFLRCVYRNFCTI